MTLISFEEFHATRKRERAQLQSTELSKKESKQRVNSVKRENDEKNEASIKPASLGSYYASRLKAAGEFVELFEVQSAIVLLIFLDLLTTTSSMLLESSSSNANENDDSPAFVLSPATISRILNSVSAFALAVFAIELLTLCFTFGLRNFLSHPGYLIDFIVVSLCMMSEGPQGAFKNSSRSNFFHVLGYIRLWRLARLVRTALESAWNVHQETEALLNVKKDEADHLLIELMRSKKSVELEIEARKRVEKMLQGYKDEVETLNEALEIAAYDVMLATDAAEEDRGNMLKEEPKEVETNLDGDVFYTGEEEISHERDHDNESRVENERSRGRTIVIQKDGTITRED